MNNRGFTLVELLVTVALIAIISLIITPTVSSVIKNNKIESCKKLFASVEKAASIYVSDNRYNIKNAFNGCETISTIGCEIKTSDLKDKGYLTGSLNNPINNDILSIDVNVKYNKDTKKYTYEMTPVLENTCK